MTMNFCLSKEEFQKLIDLKIENISLSVDDNSLRIKIENSDNWYNRLVGLTYFLSQILENKQKMGKNCRQVIKITYELPEKMFFDLQEFNKDFIKYIMRRERDKDICLEDALIQLQNDFDEYKYDG